jgi:hypothetical protein
MALSKRMALDNGVSTNYHRIVGVNVVTNVQNTIEVASYTSRSKRIDEKAWYEEAARRDDLARKGKEELTEDEEALLMTAQEHMNVFIETNVYDTPYDQSMTVEAAYGYLKGLPEFDGASDVLESGQDPGDPQ